MPNGQTGFGSSQTSRTVPSGHNLVCGCGYSYPFVLSYKCETSALATASTAKSASNFCIEEKKKKTINKIIAELFDSF